MSIPSLKNIYWVFLYLSIDIIFFCAIILLIGIYLERRTEIGKYVCKTCGIAKPSSEFRAKQTVQLKSGPKTYRNPHCIVCDNQQRLLYKEKTPHYWVAYRYGISKDEAKYWYEQSMTYCRICGKDWQEGQERLCIDHDHNTQKIRGILCKHCNHILGHSYDSPEILESALVYLKESRG